MEKLSLKGQELLNNLWSWDTLNIGVCNALEDYILSLESKRFGSRSELSLKGRELLNNLWDYKTLLKSCNDLRDYLLSLENENRELNNLNNIVDNAG